MGWNLKHFCVISDKASKCMLPDNYKDGKCDSQNNNSGCYYDGGDCCGCPGEVIQGECSISYLCVCYDPDYNPDCLNWKSFHNTNEFRMV